MAKDRGGVRVGIAMCDIVLVAEHVYLMELR